MSEAAASAHAFVSERKDLLVRTERLVREFHPSMSAGAVIATVTRCRDELVRAGVRAGLATAAETMARARLQRGQSGQEPPRPTVPRPRRPVGPRQRAHGVRTAAPA